MIQRLVLRRVVAAIHNGSSLGGCRIGIARRSRSLVELRRVDRRLDRRALRIRHRLGFRVRERAVS